MKEYKEYLKVGDEIMFREDSSELIHNKNLSITKKYKVANVKHVGPSNSIVLIKIRGVDFIGTGMFSNPIVYSNGIKIANKNSSIILIEKRSIQEELEI